MSSTRALVTNMTFVWGDFLEERQTSLNCCKGGARGLFCKSNMGVSVRIEKNPLSGILSATGAFVPTGKSFWSRKASAKHCTAGAICTVLGLLWPLGAFIRWGFYPLGLLSAVAFIRWGFYPLGLLSVGLFSAGLLSVGLLSAGLLSAPRNIEPQRRNVSTVPQTKRRNYVHPQWVQTVHQR